MIKIDKDKISFNYTVRDLERITDKILMSEAERDLKKELNEINNRKPI